MDFSAVVFFLTQPLETPRQGILSLRSLPGE
jgi:hypothetical protein